MFMKTGLSEISEKARFLKYTEKMSKFCSPKFQSRPINTLGQKDRILCLGT